MFTQLVDQVLHTLTDADIPFTVTLRQDETPQSAIVHIPKLDGHEYVWFLQPTMAARLNDAGEP